MVDLTLAHENPAQFITCILKKDPTFDVNQLLQLDKEVRRITRLVEELRHRKNELSTLAKKGITQEIRSESQAIGVQLKEQEQALLETQEKFKALYLRCPNIPFDDVPEGAKESNVVVATFGKKPEHSFAVKHHLELGTTLGWFDFEAAAIMTKSNFVVYRHEAVKLMYALIMFMLKHNAQHGYSYVLPPYVVNERSLEISGNFPKFYEEVYTIQGDNLYLIPTSEVCLSNLYRNTIFSTDQLPIRLTSATSCFRREAGGYGAHERGLIRIHQFEKVELYTYCVPEESTKELDRMVRCAEEILQALNLHYRVSLLAAQDCSFQSAKTYDIEVWLPGQNCFKEVSSASNCTDFQARRGGMRYKKEISEKTILVHTLNASSLALPRLMAALMETYQQEDGSIKIPDVLKPWML
jgi:seryl-tRNA synthetase